MQANHRFLLRNIGNIYFIFSAAPEDFPTPDSILTTNETGAYLWEQLQTPVSLENLTASFASYYEIDTASAAEDIHHFLQALQTIGALEETPESRH